MRKLLRLAALIGMIVASFSPVQAGPALQPSRGGTLRVALSGELPTLDWQFTTSFTAGYVAAHIFEGLFTVDSRLRTRPMLAERWTVSSDRRTYTITLRRGVLFHHGREMTSADAAASLTRWGRISTVGRLVFNSVQEVQAPDPSTVVVRFTEPYSLLVEALGWPHQAAVIYPREVIEEAGTGPIRRFIGTGPYRFVEHIRDRHYRLERFDRYVSRTDPPDGMAGRKVAYLDALLFVPVPDTAVRVAGLQRGEFHQIQFAPSDEYDRLRADPNIEPWIDPVPWWLTAKFNVRRGLFADVRLREAFHLATNKEEVMRGTMGPRQFWRVDPGVMVKEHPMWNDAGAEVYRRQDVERARQLLQEAGYRGQPVRWLTSMAVPPYGISAQVAKAMLERAGFTVDLQVVDFPTLLSRWSNPDLWDVASGGVTPVPDPSFLWVLLPTWPGWYESRNMQGVLRLMSRHSNPKVRTDLWRQGQQIFYREFPAIKFGDFFWFSPYRRELKGFTGPLLLYYWNAWLQR
ncbi:MAG: ABC transporter substrate-binding protein [Armatimonadota bacterium]|nr:ABC transporter substrate-binding protein [Armatimonadota bacterium]MDR7448714.1 ABC transporter substrate-binding protein [Armatimonadota bacterium]MDR7460266.1 ABC transporter substrate-binding protein [Armatimonadota bacterium]MDR7479052.1 ABC transporter substrate-binding protein [Armatimonadota bacterium]MDR7488672.1 ABC transporter substrate-binding protein [Armatimonadota bacterium]